MVVFCELHQLDPLGLKGAVFPGGSAANWVRVRTTDDNMMTNLIKQQPVLTSLQTHGPVLTFVESVAGIRISINLQKQTS